MHLLRSNGEIRESLSSLFNKLQVDQSFILGSWVPYNLPQIIVYELDPLPNYCIDHPHLRDLLLFRVPLQEHMWGVNAMLCSRENLNVSFNDWTLGAKKITRATPTCFFSTFVIAFGKIFLEYSWKIIEIFFKKFFNFFNKKIILFYYVHVKNSAKKSFKKIWNWFTSLFIT